MLSKGPLFLRSHDLQGSAHNLSLQFYLRVICVLLPPSPIHSRLCLLTVWLPCLVIAYMLNALLVISSTFVSAGPVPAGPRRGYPQASATDYTRDPQAGNSIAHRDLFGHCPYVHTLPHQIFRCRPLLLTPIGKLLGIYCWVGKVWD